MKKAIEAKLSEIKETEATIEALSAKREEILERIEAIERDIARLEEKHRQAVSDYAEGKIGVDAVQQAAIEAGAPVPAKTALKQTLDSIDRQIEEAQRRILTLEREATELRREGIYHLADRLLEELDDIIEKRLGELMVLARKADHPMRSIYNLKDHMARLVYRAEKADSISPALAKKLPPEVPKSHLVDYQMRNEYR